MKNKGDSCDSFTQSTYRNLVSSNNHQSLKDVIQYHAFLLIKCQVQDQLDDETIFPSKIGVPFPKNFQSIAKTILKVSFNPYRLPNHQKDIEQCFFMGQGDIWIMDVLGQLLPFFLVRMCCLMYFSYIYTLPSATYNNLFNYA